MDIPCNVAVGPAEVDVTVIGSTTVRPDETPVLAMCVVEVVTGIK